MAIWHAPVSLEAQNATLSGTLAGLLGVRFTAHGEDWLEAAIPVAAHMRQIMGILHGGASAACAEVVAHTAGTLVVDPARNHCVVQDSVASHIRSVAAGLLLARARPVHLGRSSQVWNVELADEHGALISSARVTLLVEAHPAGAPP